MENARTVAIDRRVCPVLGSGVYSVVFELEEKAYKLFKSGPEAPPRQTAVGRRQVFENQREAYRRVEQHPFLRTHVPAFHGCANIQEVLDEQGRSVKDCYLLDCCYILEVLTGSSESFSLGRCLSTSHLSEAIDAFRSLGIELHDSTIFNGDDPAGFKFIDFEVPFDFCKTVIDLSLLTAGHSTNAS